MIRDDDASRRLFASENDVAATLAFHNETDFLQGPNQSAPRKVRWIFVMEEKW